MGTPSLSISHSRSLKIFLCYAYHDKDIVRDTYKKLVGLGHEVWLDFEKLVGGQQWENEIRKAIANADIVLVCITKHLTTHTGYVQREIKFALDCAVEKPEGVIYLIPARLEECYTPNVLKNYHWVDLFEEQGWGVLIKTLQIRESQLFGTTYKNDDSLQNKFQQSDLINELQGTQDTSSKKKTFWDFFSLYQKSRIAGELTNNVSNILRDLLRNYPGDVEKIAASQINLLTNYYSLVLNHELALI